MRMRWIGTAAVVVLAYTPGASQAQATLGPTVAYKSDVDVGIGLMLGIPLPGLGDAVGLTADLMQFFPQRLFAVVTYSEYNANVTYDLPVGGSSVNLFVLVGINVARSSPDILAEVATDFGLNLGGGIRFDMANFRPAVGGRLEVGGGFGTQLSPWTDDDAPRRSVRGEETDFNDEEQGRYRCDDAQDAQASPAEE